MISTDKAKTVPTVSVIIPAHNEEEYIRDCLESITRQTYPSHLLEILVVDNNSTDRTQKIANEFGVTILEKSDGLVGSVRNFGARQSTGEILVFLDADCVVPYNWVEMGVSFLRSSHKLVFGGGCLVSDSPSFIEKYWVLPSSSPQKDLLGACIFIYREDFEKAGLFDETISSGEDSKLSSTLRGMGYQVHLMEHLSVTHLGNPKTFSDFIKRQSWHSENYFQDMTQSIKDPTFALILIWNLAIAFVLFSLFRSGSADNTIALLFIFIIPAIFSLKRVSRSKTPLHNLRDAPKIYIIDFLYVVGRAIGFMKSIVKITHKSLTGLVYGTGKQD